MKLTTIDKMRATIARLRRERDQEQAERKRLETAYDAVCDGLRGEDMSGSDIPMARMATQIRKEAGYPA